VAPFRNHAEISADDSSEYGLTDADSTPGSNSSANDNGPGEGAPGEIEDDASSAVVRAAASTPITLQNFHSTVSSGVLNVSWRTSMEEGNQGFNLYARQPGEQWMKLTEHLVPTQAPDDGGAKYRFSQTVNKPFTELAITDVDRNRQFFWPH